MSDLKDSIHPGWALRLQQGDRNIMHGNARGSGAIRLALVSVSVKYKIGTVAVDHFGQTRCIQKWINLGASPSTVAAIGE